MRRNTAEFEARQELRRRIARQRRRLDRRINRVADGVWIVGTLKTFVTQHPVPSVFAAAGLGTFLTQVVSRDETLVELKTRLLRGETPSRIWQDFLGIFRRESKVSKIEGLERG